MVRGEQGCPLGPRNLLRRLRRCEASKHSSEKDREGPKGPTPVSAELRSATSVGKGASGAPLGAPEATPVTSEKANEGATRPRRGRGAP